MADSIKTYIATYSDDRVYGGGNNDLQLYAGSLNEAKKTARRYIHNENHTIGRRVLHLDNVRLYKQTV